MSDPITISLTSEVMAAPLEFKQVEVPEGVSLPSLITDLDSDNTIQDNITAIGSSYVIFITNLMEIDTDLAKMVSERFIKVGQYFEYEILTEDTVYHYLHMLQRTIQVSTTIPVTNIIEYAVNNEDMPELKYKGNVLIRVYGKPYGIEVPPIKVDSIKITKKETVPDDVPIPALQYYKYNEVPNLHIVYLALTIVGGILAVQLLPKLF